MFIIFATYFVIENQLIESDLRILFKDLNDKVLIQDTLQFRFYVKEVDLV